MRKLPILLTLFLALGARSALAATRTVGPGKTYAKPCAAIAAAEPGDVIEVDANGNYAGDHCSWSTDNLTVRGVGGRAKIDGGKDPANIAAGKGIFVITAPNLATERGAHDQPVSSKPRTSVGTIDIGAYEFGNPGLPADGGTGQPSTDGPSSDPDTTPRDGGGANGAAPSEADSGCGCHVHTQKSVRGPFIALVALGLFVTRRRTPRRHMRS